MNLPDKLTLSRFGFALLLMVCLAFDLPGLKTLGFLSFLIAAATDWLDGHLARTKYGTSDFGKLMDPLADKVLVCVALVGLIGFRTQFYLPEWPMFPAWMVSLMLAREFMVTGLRLLAVEKGVVLAAGPMGKWKTGFQMGCIAFALFGLVLLRDLFRNGDEHLIRSVEFTFRWLIWGLLGVATFLTVYSGWDYFKQNWSLFLPASGDKSDKHDQSDKGKKSVEGDSGDSGGSQPPPEEAKPTSE